VRLAHSWVNQPRGWARAQVDQRRQVRYSLHTKYTQEQNSLIIYIHTHTVYHRSISLRWLGGLSFSAGVREKVQQQFLFLVCSVPTRKQGHGNL
jgi:hypothetical protein